MGDNERLGIILKVLCGAGNLIPLKHRVLFSVWICVFVFVFLGGLLLYVCVFFVLLDLCFQLDLCLGMVSSAVSFYTPIRSCFIYRRESVWILHRKRF